MLSDHVDRPSAGVLAANLAVALAALRAEGAVAGPPSRHAEDADGPGEPWNFEPGKPGNFEQNEALAM